MHRLEQRVLKWCRRESLLREADRVLVALSGGPDSVALLRVLMAIRKTLGLQLSAAHLNHSIRGESSDADQEFVRSLCHQLEIPLQCRRLPPGSLTGAGNLEARLRDARYAFLYEVAASQQAVLATGHTLDDQAETVLLRVVRGSGARGLAGIPPLRRKTLAAAETMVRVIRPLLNATRVDVLDYLESIEQPFRVDASNRDEERDRNWVRQVLMPQLERRLNPGIRRVLGGTARVFRDIDGDLRRRARLFLRRHGRRDEPETFLIEIAPLLSLSVALRRQVFQEALCIVRGHRRGVGLSHIEALLDLAQKPSGRSLSLPGCRARREFDHLAFSHPVAERNFSYHLSLSAPLFVKELGRRVTMLPVTDARDVPDVLFSMAVKDQLVVRNRRPGDRIRIDGRIHRLKTWFLERRIPLRQRPRLLVFERDGIVAAVEGVGVTDDFRTPKPGEQLVKITVS